jgi:hypothetical protein
MHDERVVDLYIRQLLKQSPADPQRHLDQDRIRRYAALIDDLPPITVFRLEDQTLLLADGYHRVAAALEAGRTTVRAEVRTGSRADALQFAVDVAMRERGVSEDQARAAIRYYSGKSGENEKRAQPDSR